MRMRSFVPYIRFLLYVLFLIAPVVILPVFGVGDTAKMLWLSMTVISILLLWSVRTFRSGNAVITWSWEAAGLGLLTLSGFISLMVSSIQKIEALTNPFGPLTFVLCTIILLFGQSFLEEKGQLILRLGLGVEASVLGLIAVYQKIGLSHIFMPGIIAVQDPLWTPAGTPIALIAILLLMLPLGATIAIKAIRERKNAIAIGALVGCGLILAGLGVTLWQIIPKAGTLLLPFPVGWSLMIASWDTAPHLLFGQGAEQFFSVFTRFRPQSLNLTPLWSIAFITNASLFLQIGTTMGVMGILALLCFLGCVISAFARHPMTLVQAGIIIFCVLFMPPALPFFITVTILILTLPGHHTVNEHIHRGWMKGIIILTPLLFAMVLLSGTWRYGQAEYFYRQAIVEGERGNGTETHTLLAGAIRVNPMIASYHIALSQTYIRLASGIIAASPASNDGSAKLSQEDTDLITQFIGNAIKEAKIAVTLAPGNVYTWTNLAHTYQELVGVAKDADTWAAAAYQKAIELDPTNPVLRLDYGGLYNKLNKFNEAQEQFLASVTLKPNYINGFYNLAYVFRELGDWDNAIKTLEQTKQLTAKGSAEEQQLDIEIMEVTKEKRSSEKPIIPSAGPRIVPELKLPASE